MSNQNKHSIIYKTARNIKKMKQTKLTNKFSVITSCSAKQLDTRILQRACTEQYGDLNVGLGYLEGKILRNEQKMVFLVWSMQPRKLKWRNKFKTRKCKLNGTRET